ncbi:MAG: adenylate/guanylate cyclase domain-containing protein [Alphaproteobacteria bacterium]
MSVTDAGALPASRPDKRRRRLPLALVLGLTIGGMMLLVVGVLLAITLSGAGANTRALLSDKANLMLEAAASSIRGQLDPGAQATDFLARRMEAGDIDIGDAEAVSAALQGAHAGLAQIAGIIFVRPDRTAIGVRKLADGSLATGEFEVVMPTLDSALESAREERERPRWGAPTWSNELETAVLNVVRGVRIDGELVGVVGAAVSVQQFSRLVGGLSNTLGQNAFALIGDDRVLAHPLLAQGASVLTPEQPLPALNGFADPVLAAIWSSQEQEQLDIVRFRPGANGHYVEHDGQGYIFVYERLYGYSDAPITVGAYFRVEEIGQEVERLMGMAMAGLVIIAVAILLSFLVAKKIARPFSRVAAAAVQVGEMSLETIRDLPESRIREIDDQARAFNGMVRALRWLEIYVPRRLARRLLDATGGAVTSMDVEVTVMFTDISGFTSWSEGRAATEVADFLNTHFATIGQAVDDTGGTLDKFIGDGAMAFWGAPERQLDHVVRACQTARRIGIAVEAENRERKSQGQPPFRMRIGIHCGTVTVGNIGAPERMNYTIVGDTVNVCQRLEQAGKELADSPQGSAAGLVVIVSDAVARRLPDSYRPALRPAGDITLRGRAMPIEICGLDTALLPDGDGAG